ncbi:MAG: glycosyltransferase [Desulfotignum sp.]|nr:glycosyltransferase [Desulfotignum sp.]
MPGPGRYFLKEKAIYHGPLSHDDLGDLLRHAHVFVLPSFYEGLPLVLMEALACGCRLVAIGPARCKRAAGRR